MEYGSSRSPFYRSMMTGLFVGIVATVVCLFFNVIYRESTNFYPADYINVSSLIFAVNLVFWVVGIVYYLFQRAFSRADIIFDVVFILVLLFCIWRVAEGLRTDDQLLNSHFRTLMIGILVILAIGVFAIPYLYHSRKFEDGVIS